MAITELKIDQIDEINERLGPIAAVCVEMVQNTKDPVRGEIYGWIQREVDAVLGILNADDPAH